MSIMINKNMRFVWDILQKWLHHDLLTAYCSILSSISAVNGRNRRQCRTSSISKRTHASQPRSSPPPHSTPQGWRRGRAPPPSSNSPIGELREPESSENWRVQKTGMFDTVVDFGRQRPKSTTVSNTRPPQACSRFSAPEFPEPSNRAPPLPPAPTFYTQGEGGLPPPSSNPPTRTMTTAPGGGLGAVGSGSCMRQRSRNKSGCRK